jgi:Tol biopolymer transport system component
VWAIDEREGWFRRANREPVQLTSGPVNFSYPIASKDGRRLFVHGNLSRGELVRYDARSGQFLPYMSGLSAEFLDFSPDGQWVAYVTYPEGALWRSRADGTERLQLTSLPMQAALPRWSPDGGRILFAANAPGRPWKTYLVSAEGGAPQPLVPGERNELDANWSPDGKQIVFGYSLTETAASGASGLYVLDIATNQIAKLPGSDGLFSGRWSRDGRSIVALSVDQQRLLLFDRSSQTWRELVKAFVSYPTWSRDGTYIYFQGGPNEPTILRVRLSDQRIEPVASLKDVSQVFGVFGRWSGLAPDDSPVLLRDVSTREIYALDWRTRE